MMPKITEIHLACTPEEWNLLCRAVDAYRLDAYTYNAKKFKDEISLVDKISEINKRLVFASSVED